MTMPHLMNCEHQPDGRCPACDPTPSKAARRAAEIIWQTHDADGPPEAIAEIIERETGVGEAAGLIERLCDAVELTGDPGFDTIANEARHYLQRFNQD